MFGRPRSRVILKKVFRADLSPHALTPEMPGVQSVSEVVQQLSVSKEELHLEQKERSSSLIQEITEPLHIKEEQEELWSNQEGEQLEGPEETDIIKFTFSPVPVKSEDDEENPEFSQLHQVQTEQMETGADGRDRRGSEQARSFGSEGYLIPETEVKTEDSSEPETDDSADWTDTTERKSSLNSGDICKNKRQEKLHCCSLCGRSFIKKASLTSHMRIHTGPKRFTCPECGKGYFYPRSMTRHLEVHARQRLFSKIPNNKWKLSRHVIINKGEKIFTCSECGKRFKQKSYLTLNMANPKKPFSCIYCGQGFDLFDQLRIHKCAGGQALESLQRGTVEKTGTDKEDCGGSEKAKSSNPERHLQLETEGKTEAETEDGADWKETTEHQSGLKSMKNIKSMTPNTDKESHCCVTCRKILNKNVTLKVI
ncbi:zinc finger protein 135-like [Cheilinus undulatus]|uniref:zinc finger protein 135-like n=1 Tax=Cheilinus undulatus TaxID=241271 RepID=UPI001BD33C3C|nr:zinc finger protein 135-like [Cheilinus undulatus]